MGWPTKYLSKYTSKYLTSSLQKSLSIPNLAKLISVLTFLSSHVFPCQKRFSFLSLFPFISLFSLGDFIQAHGVKFDLCADSAEIYVSILKLCSEHWSQIYNSFIPLDSINVSNKTCSKLNSRFILLNQVLPLCSISVDGNSIFVVGQAKNFGAFLISLSHISHPTYQQIMLALPSKYIQKMTISHLLPRHLCWSKLPSFISTTAMTSNLSCLLLPRDHFHAVIFSVPCSELSMTSFPKSDSFSSVDSQISFPTTLSHTHSTLDTLALLFLKISMDLSASGTLCFLFPLPYHPMVSLGLVLTLSWELPSQRDLPQHSHLQFQVCNCGLIFLP